MQTPESGEEISRRELLMTALKGLEDSFGNMATQCRELGEQLNKIDELPDTVIEMQLELCRTLAAKL